MVGDFSTCKASAAGSASSANAPSPVAESSARSALTVVEVAERIGMRGEILGRVANVAEHELPAPDGRSDLWDDPHVIELIAGLCRPDEGGRSRAELNVLLAPDEGGWRMLTCMLQAAGQHSWGQYRALGIPERIFDATMACFTRFVNEYKASYGGYGFDRGFWTTRQLSLRLFRLGELEFELAQGDRDVPRCAGTDRAINIHIPSDAAIGREVCDESIARSREFIAGLFPDWTHQPYMCASWLLSPALKPLLRPDSKIIQFQNRFEILDTDDNAEDWREWVFQRSQAPVGELPETTSLQRNMKRYLLSGGKVGTGIGRLRA